jgi:galactose mutarotase-like enzyme
MRSRIFGQTFLQHNHRTKHALMRLICQYDSVRPRRSNSHLQNRSMTPTLDLRNGDLRLTLAPGLGGSIAAFYRSWHNGAVDRRTHWLRPASEASLASGELLEMASFPLLPFCNRIRDGRAEFEGREIRFQPNHPNGESRHPLHGIGWQRPWRVLASSEASASLALDFTASDEWPWSFSARQDIVLAPDRLGLTLTLTNTDTAPMPAGIGQHPYFPAYRWRPADERDTRHVAHRRRSDANRVRARARRRGGRPGRWPAPG